MSDNKDSDEREQTSKNDDVKVSDIVEDLKVGKLSSHKYVNNVEIESDKRNMVDMNDEKDSAETDEISKKDEKTLTGVDEESEEIDTINEKEQDGLESDKSETDERYQIEIPELLKIIDGQEKADDDDLVDNDIDQETNDEEYEEIDQIEEKK